MVAGVLLKEALHSIGVSNDNFKEKHHLIALIRTGQPTIFWKLVRRVRTHPFTVKPCMAGDGDEGDVAKADKCVRNE
jgi:hypothetical protein